MKKTKKTKIIISIILLLATCFATVWTTLSLTKVSYNMYLSAPIQIIVYQNSETSNIVYEPDDSEFKKLYSLVRASYRQSALDALFNMNISKNVKVIKNELSTIDFTGIKINFIYNSPQVIKLKNKVYYNNGENYWYQSLIFDISNDGFKYNSVAIIPPLNDNHYESAYTYHMHYKAYSNFDKTYHYVSTLFQKLG